MNNNKKIGTQPIHLKLAKRNLEAARCLYSNRFYPQSIFYLEQAVEEAVKFIGLRLGICDEYDLRIAIKHEPTKIYIKVIKYLKGELGKIKFFKDIPILRQMSLVKNSDLDTSTFEAKINKLERYLENPNRHISEKELNLIILELTKFEKEIENQWKIGEIEKTKDIKREFLALASSISKADSFKIPSKLFEKELEQIKSLSPEDIGAYISLLIRERLFQIYLMFLCAILSPHAVRSRYFFPPKDDPLSVYTEEHLLIKIFSQLADLTDKALEGMFRAFKDTPSNGFANKVPSVHKV